MVISIGSGGECSSVEAFSAGTFHLHSVAGRPVAAIHIAQDVERTSVVILEVGGYIGCTFTLIGHGTRLVQGTAIVGHLVLCHVGGPHVGRRFSSDLCCGIDSSGQRASLGVASLVIDRQLSVIDSDNGSHHGHVTSYLLIELDGLLARLVVAETVISVTGYTVEAQSGELVIVSALKSSDDSIAIVDGDAIGILGGILVLFQSISITALTYVFITSALQRLGGSIVSEINVFVGLYFTISDSDLNDII